MLLPSILALTVAATIPSPTALDGSVVVARDKQIEACALKPGLAMHAYEIGATDMFFSPRKRGEPLVLVLLGKGAPVALASDAPNVRDFAARLRFALTVCLGIQRIGAPAGMDEGERAAWYDDTLRELFVIRSHAVVKGKRMARDFVFEGDRLIATDAPE